MKKTRVKKEFLEQLRKVPVVQVACERSGISRNSAYRWCKEDTEFKTEMENALKEGEAVMNDLGEIQLYTLVKEKHWGAINFCLKKRNPKFKDTKEIIAPTHKDEEDILSPEQEHIVQEALRLVSPVNTSNIQEHRNE